MNFCPQSTRDSLIVFRELVDLPLLFLKLEMKLHTPSFFKKPSPPPHPALDSPISHLSNSSKHCVEGCTHFTGRPLHEERLFQVFLTQSQHKKVRLRRKMSIGKKSLCLVPQNTFFKLSSVFPRFSPTSNLSSTASSLSLSTQPTKSYSSRKLRELGGGWVSGRPARGLTTTPTSQGTWKSRSLFLIPLLLAEGPPSSFHQQVPNLQPTLIS